MKFQRHLIRIVCELPDRCGRHGVEFPSLLECMVWSEELSWKVSVEFSLLEVEGMELV